VKGIPISCTQRELIEAFSKYGRIERGFIMYNHKTGCSRGFGFVEFTDPEEALKVISQTVTISDVQVEVSMAVERAKGVRNRTDSRKKFQMAKLLRQILIQRKCLVPLHQPPCFQEESL